MLRLLSHPAWLIAILWIAALPAHGALCTVSTQVEPSGLPNPILFVTQMPVAADFATVGSTFANHLPGVNPAGRGGDLYILYPDGELCNLTREAGFGEAGTHQGSNSISVRDPSVSFDGTKALFSMVIGAADSCFQLTESYWQLYELNGLGRGEAMSITKVANQPQDFNNLYPVYSPDGRILFVSDRPRDGRRHLYPQQDEYESTPSNSGLWALDSSTGELQLLDHSPSGNFDPLIDSFGRIVFTRWDHLQTDQQAANPSYDNFDWASEEPDAATSPAVDVFPEPRFSQDPNVNDHRFNHFFPWMMNTDGSELETLNHIGRHELHDFFSRSRLDDPNLSDFIDATSGRLNDKSIESLFHMAEDPTQAGRYYGVDAPEFDTHAAGQVVRVDAPPSLGAHEMVITRVSHDETRDPIGEGQTPGPDQTGHFRDPMPLTDGTVLAVHTAEMRGDADGGTDQVGDCTDLDHVPATTVSRYDFRIKKLVANGDHFVAGGAITGAAPISRTLEYFTPDFTVSYSGPMWELSPVEVRTRTVPPITQTPVPAIEAQVFADEGVDLAQFQDYLRSNELALVVSRDVTTREKLDKQQGFNLRVPGGTQTVPEGGVVYDVRYLQFFQGDQVRGTRLSGSQADPGRRVLAREMHQAIDNPPTTGNMGSVNLGLDGSMAAMVPAHRAVSWQLTDPSNEPVVRERYWVTFQAGEVRVCASCHGLNDVDQVGDPKPTNAPEALRTLLQHWKASQTLFTDGFESGDLSAWSSSIGAAITPEVSAAL